MRTYICLFALAASAGAIFAQGGGAPVHGQVTVMTRVDQEQRVDQEKLRHAQEMGFATIIGAEMMPGKPVTGAPYTADTVTEFKQVLGDGTQIRNSTTGTVARDSEGRTRREQSVAAFGAAMPAEEKLAVVVISDPVAGFSYTLNTREKVATKIPLPRIETTADAVKMIHVQTAGGGETFNIRGLRTPHGAGEAKRESLGTRMIEGVQAEGTRTVSVIPAGAMGNDRPIEVVGERWLSPQLQTVVMTRHSDPRSGENTYRLLNIVRGEPSRTLFEVPPDYAVRETPKPYILREKIERQKEE